MLTKTTGDMPTTRKNTPSIAAQRVENMSSLIRTAAAPLVIAGWLGMSFPSAAITLPTSYRNQYRVCAGRLLRSGISAEAVAATCARALRPNDVARCVERIDRQTDIAAEDALVTCRQVRRPIELASCVVGINRYTKEQAAPGVLDYCGRSLLPVNFAECVVGLRREIEFDPTQAMETCISASDRISEFSPNFIPSSQTPVQPATTPTVPPDQTPSVAPSTPTDPQNAPANPGGV